MTEADRVRWRFAVSSTLRGIYVIRYFLFSGGTAIAGALIERGVVGGERSAAGFLIGLGAGLVLFRGQLRALSWPTLILGQEAIYLVRRRTAEMIPWSSIREIAVAEGFVSLRLLRRSADLDPAEPIRLQARKYGTAADSLEKTLRRLAANRQLRLRLPSEEELRRASAIPPPSHVTGASAPPTDPE